VCKKSIKNSEPFVKKMKMSGSLGGGDFFFDSHCICNVDKYVHLGHVISSDLSDKEDIQRCRSYLVGQINNVICFFGKLDVVTKMKLLISYCYSLYVCVIWNLMDPGIEQVCSAWRAGICRVWGLPDTSSS